MLNPNRRYTVNNLFKVVYVARDYELDGFKVSHAKCLKIGDIVKPIVQYSIMSDRYILKAVRRVLNVIK